MEATVNKTKIVCMGDSITEGFGPVSVPGASYPTALNDFLGDAYWVFNQGKTSCCTINRELDGRVVGLPYAREQKYEEAIKLKGDIYIIMLGTNDAQDGLDPATGKKDPYSNLIALKEYFSEDYLSIIKDVREAVPDAVIFLVSPIPIKECIWPKHQEKYLAKLLPTIKKLARDNDCEFIDMHREFDSLPVEVVDTLYQADGLHPNIAGTNVLASMIANYLKLYFKTGSLS